MIAEIELSIKFFIFKNYHACGAEWFYFQSSIPINYKDVVLHVISGQIAIEPQLYLIDEKKLNF